MLTPNLLMSQASKELSSPDENLNFKFSLADDGAIGFSVEYKKNQVVLPSQLGINGRENRFKLLSADYRKQDTTWNPLYGERSTIRDHFEEMTICLLQENDARREIQIQVRAYNEGIAFRYFFPEHASGGADLSIKRELINFTFPEGTKAWFTSRAQGHYNLLPLSGWSDEAERPLTLQLPNGLIACLTEAGMVDYSRTKFTLNTSKANTISCSLYDGVDAFTPFATPWRVVMVVDQAGKLLENNDIVLNLNPPCAIENTSWIKPGKVMREVTLSTKGAKDLVDFAVKRNLQYIHFDAGWYGYEYTVKSDASKVNVDPRRNPKNDLDLPEVIRYANERGIGVFLYVNQRALYQQLDTILPLYEKWGVKGVKFGFVEVGSHRWTTWLHDAVKKCAKYHLMVDIHDEYRPTGFSRTYPNLLTQEGVCGNEEMPDATHNTILPFTRFVAGAADYTICYYHRPELKPSLAQSQNTHVLKTTSAHQIALSLVYYSPLQFMYWYDKPSDSQDEPELEFFDRLHTVWDDTRVVNGEIAKYATVARRSGKEWFVGSITNNEARAIKIPLNFLDSNKKYEAKIYVDDPKSKVRTKVSVKKITVNSSTVVAEKLYASGGLAIWIKPIEN
jgi:Glycoside hydrolase 97.